MTPPLVYIIILNYDGKEHLEYCLPSIAVTDYPDFRVLVVDNASTDGSPVYVRQNFPDVEVLEQATNRGYAGGSNDGIRYALERGARYVLLANNDIRVHPGWVAGAVQVAQSENGVGFVGFNVFGITHPGNLAEYQKAYQAWQTLSYEESDMIEGMALFIDTRVFELIGFLDETYFAYAEEQDLELRAQAASIRLVKTNLPIWHFNGGSFNKIPRFASYLALRNRVRMFIKRYTWYLVLRDLLMLINLSCNPFWQGDLTDVTIRRLRHGNVVVNSWVLLRALVWNLVHLPQTLRIRNDENRAIALAISKLHTDSFFLQDEPHVS